MIKPIDKILSHPIMVSAEDLVTYEQAVKLKELGFDWKCNHFYNQSEGQELEMVEYVPWDFVDFNYHDFNDPTIFGDTYNGKVTSAPTLAQVQKWLREVKQIDLFVTKELSKYYWYRGEEFQIGNCDTYEEALSKGIDTTLKTLT